MAKRGQITDKNENVAGKYQGSDPKGKTQVSQPKKKQFNTKMISGLVRNRKATVNNDIQRWG